MYYVTGLVHGDDEAHTRCYLARTAEEADALFTRDEFAFREIEPADQQDRPVYITDSGKAFDYLLTIDPE